MSPSTSVIVLNTASLTSPATSGLTKTPSASPSSLFVSSSQVKKQLKRLNQNKAADCVSSRVLKTCAEQLCGILKHLFNLSLSQEKVPVLWKTSCPVLVPKQFHASALSDYRPVSLTSHAMKVLERLIGSP